MARQSSFTFDPQAVEMLTLGMSHLAHSAFHWLMWASLRMAETGVLPKEEEKLASLAHCKPEEWKVVRSDILSVLTPVRGGLAVPFVVERVAWLQARASKGGRATAAKYRSVSGSEAVQAAAQYMLALDDRLKRSEANGAEYQSVTGSDEVLPTRGFDSDSSSTTESKTESEANINKNLESRASTRSERAREGPLLELVTQDVNCLPTGYWLRCFDEFWRAYPHVDGRSHRGVAEALWMDVRPHNAAKFREIMAGLDACKASDEWKRDLGAYVPAGERFVRRRMWDAERVTGDAVRPLGGRPREGDVASGYVYWRGDWRTPDTARSLGWTEGAASKAAVGS